MNSFDYPTAMAFIHERSGYDRGFISNPFAGDDAARRGLVRTERVLDQLGRPDRSYPILHIAGSKGKGSTATFLAAIQSAAGWRCGRFLSPHLHRFNERFAVDNQTIGDADFAGCVAVVREATHTVEALDPTIGHLTAWEISTAIALLWFQQEGCDVAVLEVGMGGLLDATNVIQPAASLITRLDLEHTAILGNTIEEIARNKAGIIKAGAPAYTVNQQTGAIAVLRQRAAEVDTPLAVSGDDWTVAGDSEDFDWAGWGVKLSHLSIGLFGEHQVENAGLAIASVIDPASLIAAKLPVSESAIRQGLANAIIPGRFEVVEIDASTTVVLDGAHTPASAQVLAEAIKTRYPDHQVTAVVAMLADKEPLAFLEPLLPVVDGWFITQPRSPRALDCGAMLNALHHLNSSGLVFGSIGESIAASLTPSLDGRPRLVLVTGSLTTVAEGRSQFNLDNAGN